MRGRESGITLQPAAKRIIAAAACVRSACRPYPSFRQCEEFAVWLGETVEALKLQRPLPDGMLDIVARAESEDGASDWP
jgi:hypothetical protein